MDFFKLTKEYENRIARIRKWNNFKKSKYEKNINILSILLGIILSIATIVWFFKFKSDIKKQYIWIACALFFEAIYILIINRCSKIKTGNKINNKEIISTFDIERLKSLRRLFIRENICFDDVEKIQITINELINLKKQIIPIYDIGKFIVNPLMIIATSFLTIFLDHLTQSEDIRIQATFLLFILLFILIIIALVLVIIFMFVKPIIKLVFRKYDDFISDLKLLQVINYK